MARATWLLGVISVVSGSLSLWLYLDNRSLRAELDARPAARAPAAAAPVVAAARPVERTTQPQRTVAPIAQTAAGPAPALPDAPSETRMERRVRRTEEFGAQ